MKVKYLLFLVILFTYSNVKGLPTVIYGNSSAGNSFVFRLYKDADAFSGLRVLLDQKRPDKTGSFMLGFEAHEIQKVIIEVGFQSMSFFIIPGKTYHLNFNEVSIENQNVFLPQKPLHVVFEDEDMLNMVLDGFEYEYQKFLSSKFLLLIKYRDKEIYEGFSSQMNDMFEESPLKDSLAYFYVKDYIRFKLAELALVAKVESTKELGETYLSNQAILFQNPAYIGFFKKYFDKYLLETDDGKDYYQLRNLINKGNQESQILDELGRNPVLLKERLRELVFLYSLKQVFYNSDFKQKAINNAFIYFNKNSKFSNNRRIAANLSISLNRIIPGNSVPSIKLKNKDNQEKSLINYKGKKVYLMFITPNCETCQADIRILKSNYSDIQDQVNLLTILVGFKKDFALKWIDEQNINWDYLWFNDDFALLNDYQVKTFPKYLLLDEESKLLQYFPPKPRENFLSFIKNLKKQEKAKSEKREESAKDPFRRN